MAFVLLLGSALLTLYLYLIWMQELADIGRWNVLSLPVGQGVVVLAFAPEIGRHFRAHFIAVAFMVLMTASDLWMHFEPRPVSHLAFLVSGYFTLRLLALHADRMAEQDSSALPLPADEKRASHVPMSEFERAEQLVLSEFQVRSRIRREDLLATATRLRISELGLLEAIAKYPVILHDPRDDSFWLKEIEPPPNFYDSYFEGESEDRA